jgi:hypothetical protein
MPGNDARQRGLLCRVHGNVLHGLIVTISHRMCQAIVQSFGATVRGGFGQ